MSWTPENDRILLLKIVETHSIVINADKIAGAWRKSTASILLIHTDLSMQPEPERSQRHVL